MRIRFRESKKRLVLEVGLFNSELELKKFVKNEVTPSRLVSKYGAQVVFEKAQLAGFIAYFEEVE